MVAQRPAYRPYGRSVNSRRATPRAIGSYLRGQTLSVRTSPLSRARETCHFGGLGGAAVIDDDLREWDYSIYEGRTTIENRKEFLDWTVWLSAITDGESLEQVAARVRQVIGRHHRRYGRRPLRPRPYPAGSLRLLDRPAALTGRSLALDTATLGVLGYERQTRVIRRWNVAP